MLLVLRGGGLVRLWFWPSYAGYFAHLQTSCRCFLRVGLEGLGQEKETSELLHGHVNSSGNKQANGPYTGRRGGLATPYPVSLQLGAWPAGPPSA